MKIFAAVILGFSLVASATAQMGSPVSKETAKSTWKQLADAGTTVPTAASSTSTLVMNEGANDSPEKGFSFVTNRSGQYFVRVTDCNGETMAKLLSINWTSYPDSPTAAWPLTNTRDLAKAMPNAVSPCLIEAYNTDAGLERVSWINLQAEPSNLYGFVSEAKTNDQRYRVTIAGPLPKGSSLALGTSAISSEMASEIVAGYNTFVFPATTQLYPEKGGPTTLTIVTPDGKQPVTIVYQRRIQLSQQVNKPTPPPGVYPALQP